MLKQWFAGQNQCASGLHRLHHVLLACMMVESRCAINSVMRRLLADRWRTVRVICASEIESSADVASSKINTRGWRIKARAIDSRCFSPPESFMPLSPMTQSSPSGAVAALPPAKARQIRRCRHQVVLCKHICNFKIFVVSNCIKKGGDLFRATQKCKTHDRACRARWRWRCLGDRRR